MPKYPQSLVTLAQKAFLCVCLIILFYLLTVFRFYPRFCTVFLSILVTLGHVMLSYLVLSLFVFYFWYEYQVRAIPPKTLTYFKYVSYDMMFKGEGYVLIRWFLFFTVLTTLVLLYLRLLALPTLTAHRPFLWVYIGLF